MTLPIMWTIAGSDSSAGAGIEADIKTCQSLGVHACSIIAAITAQNNHKINSIHYTSIEFIENQINTLKNTLPPVSIKVGMLGNIDLINCLADFFQDYKGKVVLDPLLISSSGRNLFSTDLHSYLTNLKLLFPYTHLLTPNIIEAEKILGCHISSQADIESAAKELLSMGVENVIIKGGHTDGEFCQDYWTNGEESFWLANKRLPKMNYRGTGCVFSSAISACLALGYDMRDAMVIAKMYVSYGIRNAIKLDDNTAILAHAGWPENEMDMPFLSDNPVSQMPEQFTTCESRLGLYPVIDSSQWLEKLIPSGVKSIQLRIKNKAASELEDEIKRSIFLAKKNNISLFINDYWEMAIKHGAYGVHLGQEDLGKADLEKIRKSGLRLGVSTHCYHEVARAHGLSPSYVACGPVYLTTSKVMPFSPQGLPQLQRWRRTLNYPLVAIGGINLERLSDVVAAEVDGVAMISAITESHDVNETVKTMIARCK